MFDGSCKFGDNDKESSWRIPAIAHRHETQGRGALDNAPRKSVASQRLAF